MNGDVNIKKGDEKLTTSINATTAVNPYFNVHINNQSSISTSHIFSCITWNQKQKIISEKNKNNVIKKSYMPISFIDGPTSNSTTMFYSTVINASNVTSTTTITQKTLPDGTYDTNKSKINLTIETAGMGQYPCDSSGNISHSLIYKIKDVPISKYVVLTSDIISKLIEQYEGEYLYYTHYDGDIMFYITEWDTL